MNKQEENEKATGWWRRRSKEILLIFFIAGTSILLYGPGLDHEFVFDDMMYISDNVNVKKGVTLDNLKWAITDSAKISWQPVTWLSILLDYELYGLKPWGYHLNNLLLHIINSLLLFFTLRRMTGSFWPSALVASLFAVHPLNIESVVWASQRKNLLSALFWILAMRAYVWYVGRPNLWRYLLVGFLFILGLMSKLTMIPFPMAMFLLDYWPLGRLRAGSKGGSSPEVPKVFRISKSPWLRLALEKVPWLLIAAVVVFVLVFFDVNKQMSAVKHSLWLRLANAVVSYVIYLGKLFWPTDLAIWYPFPEIVPLWQVWGSLALLGTITIAVLWMAARRPYLVVGWLWYMGVLVPALGLIQGVIWPGRADRHLYLPALGIFMMAAFVFFYWAKQRSYRKVVFIAVSTTLVFSLSLVTRHQLCYWKTPYTVFKHTLEVTKDNYLAHTNYGDALMRQKLFEEALIHTKEALRIAPTCLVARLNIGEILNELGRHQEAYQHLQKAIRMAPKQASGHANIGIAAFALGNLEEARKHFTDAVRLSPKTAAYRVLLGRALNSLRRPREAVPHLLAALHYDPEIASAYFEMGVSLDMLGDLEGAVKYYKEALRLKHEPYVASVNCGAALFKLGRAQEAIPFFREALKINPDSVEALSNLAGALADSGQLQEAIAYYQKALGLKPDLPALHYNLGMAMAATGKDQEAVLRYKKALELNPNFLPALEALKTHQGLTQEK